uniref:Uncharacterized protein n=1 Tax=Penaeus monodon TaxID=6687 RepID=Q8MWB7_PENMO|nr:putative protein [Penaeus monodon]
MLRFCTVISDWAGRVMGVGSGRGQGEGGDDPEVQHEYARPVGGGESRYKSIKLKKR